MRQIPVRTVKFSQPHLPALGLELRCGHCKENNLMHDLLCPLQGRNERKSAIFQHRMEFDKKAYVYALKAPSCSRLHVCFFCECHCLRLTPVKQV